jgi:hypothetical protein
VLIDPTSPGPGNPAISTALFFCKLFVSDIVLIVVDDDIELIVTFTSDVLIISKIVNNPYML